MTGDATRVALPSYSLVLCFCFSSSKSEEGKSLLAANVKNTDVSRILCVRVWKKRNSFCPFACGGLKSFYLTLLRCFVFWF